MHRAPFVDQLVFTAGSVADGASVRTSHEADDRGGRDRTLRDSSSSSVARLRVPRSLQSRIVDAHWKPRVRFLAREVREVVEARRLLNRPLFRSESAHELPSLPAPSRVADVAGSSYAAFPWRWP
jgi:hypothetical protein